MKIGIIAAMEQELKTLVSAMGESMHETYIANMTFYDGEIAGKPVTLVQSGVGKVNASIATTMLITNFEAEFIVNTGSAGAIQSGIKVGELVVASDLSYNDADATAFGYKFGQVPQMPETYPADQVGLDKLTQSALELEWTVHKGQIVTGDSFIASKDKIKEIQSNFKEAYVTEMEGAAVAQTAYQFAIPFIVVRAVSDSADEKAEVSFDQFVEAVGAKSAELVIEFIKQM